MVAPQIAVRFVLCCLKVGGTNLDLGQKQIGFNSSALT
jgi:hypothetical protein